MLPLWSWARRQAEYMSFGAVLVAAAAGGHGWRVTYLGTGLPAVEIAGSALRTGARAVALSIVYPADDPNLAHELTALRRYLPAGTTVIAGGRSAPAYCIALEEIGATTASSLADLCGVLGESAFPGRGGAGSIDLTRISRSIRGGCACIRSLRISIDFNCHAPSTW